RALWLARRRDLRAVGGDPHPAPGHRERGGGGGVGNGGQGGLSSKEGPDMARTAEEALQLKTLLNKKYKYFDYKWDLVFWVTALPVVAAAADITKLLFAGDWDFWTDWKDRQWWMTLTPFAMIIIPSALQYIQWLAWKFPTGCTYTAVGLWLVSWLGRGLRREMFVDHPLHFVSPAPIVPRALCPVP